MAQEKVRRWSPAILHGTIYTLPYALITQNLWALAIIGGTHIVIDRFRLVKYLIWAKNQLTPRAFRYTWAEAKNNSGFPRDTPAYLATWLMIIVDNGLHVSITVLALVGTGTVDW
jgi:hypothetical protein